MASQAPTELERLGTFASELRLSSIPQEVVGLAKLAILNIISGILVSDHPRLNPGRSALLRYAQSQGAAPRSSIVGTAQRTSPELAALVTSGSAMIGAGRPAPTSARWSSRPPWPWPRPRGGMAQI